MPVRSTTPRPRRGGTSTSSNTRPTCTPGFPASAAPLHGVRQVSVPWARPESGFTLLFEALLMAPQTEMPVRAVADLVGEHDTRLWRVLHHYVEVLTVRGVGR